MRYKRNIAGLMVIWSLTLMSCDKYLDVKPKGFTLLNTVNDYEQWLNDAQGLDLVSDLSTLNQLADNVDNPIVRVPPSAANDLVYTWADQYTSNLNAAPYFWGPQYARINKYNTVLAGIDKANGGTEQQRKSLKAEALLGRSYEYVYLINEYGKPYDPATAAEDPGVPLVTSNDVAQTVPPRSTVQIVYDRIIADIHEAIPDLPPDNSQNRFRGSIAAAYSVLARIYLLMGNYTDASKNASLALQNSAASMMDFNNIPIVTTMPSVGNRSDVLYGRENIGGTTPTLTFVRSYDANDRRLKLWYRTTDNYTARGNTGFYPLLVNRFFAYINSGTSVQEMKLIIAEAAARASDPQNLQTALQQLNEVRIHRFPASVYQPLQETDPETVLNLVLRERGFELPYNAQRWFDMRRLDKEGRMPTVNRYDAQGNVIATLEPHSPKYTLQIPIQVLQYNPKMEQNPL